MFLAQAIKPGNNFLKYTGGFFIAIIAMFLGQIPFGIAIAVKGMTSNEPVPVTEESMLRYLDLNLSLFLLLLSFAIGLLALILVVKNLHHQKVREVVTSRPKIDWSRFFFAFGLWAKFSIITTLKAYFI